MNDKEVTIMGMIRAGCCSYLLKDTAPEILELALREVYHKSYYNSDLHSSNLGKMIIENQSEFAMVLNDKELEFLRLSCTNLTYKEMGAKMKTSSRAIDTFRESIFIKFNVQSRTGMVMEGIRRGLIVL